MVLAARLQKQTSIRFRGSCDEVRLSNSSCSTLGTTILSKSGKSFTRLLHALISNMSEIQLFDSALQSGEILGILEQMKETFESDLLGYQKEEGIRGVEGHQGGGNRR